jgi:hypothetical protein
MESVDDRTVERLLQGALAPEDAPLGYGGVATLLHEARAEARSATSVRAEHTIAAMVAAIGGHAEVAVPRPARRLRTKAAAGAAAGFLAVFGSLTTAGALPSPAQNGVATVLGTVGIDVPRADGSDEGVKPSKSDEKDEQDNGNGVSGDDPKINHGQCVSEVAGSGGEVVSEVARSDCGKDPKVPKPDDPGNGNGPPGGGPPGQSQDKNKDKAHPTHPPQSNSGGSSGSNAGGNGNGNGHNASGNGNGGAAKPDK